MKPQNESLEKDIQWCFSSPGLLHPEYSWPKDLVSDSWLKKLCGQDLQFQEIDQETIQSSNRLGRYVEAIFANVFDQSSQTELICKNEVYYRGKQSLGEIDFIVKDLESNHYFHIELSCKFYVGQIKQYGYAWIGTNARDHFETKLERFFHHQLALLDRKEAHSILENYQIPKNKIQAVGLFIGWLFYPFEVYTQKSLMIENWLNPQHQRAWWISLKQFQMVCARFPNLKWTILNKKQWLRPQEHHEIKELYDPQSFEEVCKNYFAQYSRSFMVAGYDDHIEQTRGFLMEENHPVHN